MGGTIDNNIIALIYPEIKFLKSARDGEKNLPNTYGLGEGANLAGKTEGMTQHLTCNTGAMWEVYEPTPLTREYLIEEGYMND